MLSKRWLVASTAPPDLLNRYREMSPVMAQVLYNRGFQDPNEAYRFLYTKEIASNPFSMKGMSQAVARIRRAIKQREPIVVYGDFDCDGVTSTTVLMQVLKALNAVVKPYIPRRLDEGYGLNTHALVKLAQAGVKLVITVDCGIRSVEEVEAGKIAGLDLIVTDHHSIGPEIPKALAVVNPKQEDCKYPEDMLAGVGVAFRLAEALLTAANGMHDRYKPIVTPDDLLDLVAMGTVADLMPLNHLENRVLVRQGLEVINKAKRPGVHALLEVAGIKPGTVNTTGIGFGLAPRINAAGRLDDAMLAYRLLSADGIEDAQQWAAKLQALNVQRQELTREAQEIIRERLEAERQIDLPLIFASHRDFRPGIVGLVAGRVTEEFFRPAIVMEEGETESRASCRSIPQFDITHALDQCADLLVRHGGHALAAGFTVLNENIPALKKRLLEIAERALTGQELMPTLDLDGEVDIHQLSEALVDEFSQLEPTGNANPPPLLMTRNVRVLECRTVGKESQHLKLKFARAGQPPLDAIGFGLGEWAAVLPERIDVVYQLEINEWNGRQSLQLNLQDIRLPSVS